MAGFKKLAVSLPDATFKALEKQRAKMNRTRSDAVTTAIDHWLKSFETAELDRRSIEAYRRIPEDPHDVEAWTSSQEWGEWAPGKALRASEPTPKLRRK
jgi:hypothetical protein